MRTLLVVLLMVLVLWSCIKPLQAEPGAQQAAVTAAQNWLVLGDRGDYQGSWKQASSYFRGAIPERKWQRALEGVRKPLGKAVSRKMTKAQETTRLPGVSDGRYTVMWFKTSFVRKNSAVEIVVFTLDKDQKWRAAGYFIK
jgi:hypothetical protein